MSKQKPVAQVRIGAVRAAIWKNEAANGPLYKVTFTRSYKQGEEWKSTDSFGRDSLLVLAKVADLAHTRIVELQNGSEDAPAE